MEYFDVVDEKGNPTGETIERKEAHRMGIRHRTGHVWILRKHMDENQVLVQKRAEGKDSFPGCYDISSAGHVPAGKDYVESALRELEEELGLIVNPEELLDCGVFSEKFRSKFHGEEFIEDQVCKVFILFKDVEISELTLQQEELDGAMWIKFEDLLDAVESGRYQGEEFPNCIYMEELQILKEHL